MKLKYRTENVISVQDWDDLVQATYGKPYSFQQQDGCKNRGNEYITVPLKYGEDYPNDTVPEKVNGNDMGVSFAAWLARDPTQKLSNPEDQNEWSIRLWWERNFYPNAEIIADDLCKRGLMEEGEYTINIDW